MSRPADFEWDDAKAASNVAKHLIPFTFAVRIFDDPNCMIVDTTRAVDRESRQKAIGMIGGRLIALIYTRRSEVLRVISARRANAGEERLYGTRAL